MKWISWANKRVKTLDIFDIGLTKLSMIFATLFLVSIWPGLAGLAWYWYLIGLVILSARPMYQFFK